MTTPKPADDVAAMVERFQLCADDPMWADHAEVPKVWCKAVAAMLTRQAEQIAEITAERDRLLQEEACHDQELYDWEQDFAQERERAEAVDKRIAELEESLNSATVALEIIAGKRPCFDNLMSNVDLANAFLATLRETNDDQS